MAEGLQLEERMAGVAGTEHVRCDGGAVVVAPADAEEVAQVLRVVGEARARVKVVGAGTKQGWFNPIEADIVLRTGRMNAVREHAAQDLTASVDAGCAWADMQRQLAAQGQRVALDPLWPERATVGGVVAANDSGALRLRYGSLRDLVIGMTIVLADGTIARSGGKVVKNVAGYDMHKLMTGAAGTLGVVTRVNFRLHPIERSARSWTVISPDVPALAKMMHEVRDSQMMVDAMQLRAGESAAGREACALDILFAAGGDCLDEQSRWLRQRASGLAVEEADSGVWMARQGIFDQAELEGESAAVFKMSVLPTEIARIIARLQAACAAARLSFAIVAQATGIAALSLAGDAAARAQVVREARAEAEASGGSVVLQSASAVPAQDRWGSHGDALPLMRRVKHALDPNGILNPGRYLGGI